jgi:hypothetical protein
MPATRTSVTSDCGLGSGGLLQPGLECKSELGGLGGYWAWTPRHRLRRSQPEFAFSPATNKPPLRQLRLNQLCNLQRKRTRINPGAGIQRHVNS